MTPLTIEQAKDKAAREFLFANWNNAVRNSSENDLNVITNRAMILFSESQLQCKMEEIEQGLPTIDDLIFSDPVEIKGAIWMRNEVLTLLKHNTP